MTFQKAKRISWVLFKDAFWYTKQGVILAVMAAIGIAKILLAIAFTENKSDNGYYTGEFIDPKTGEIMMDEWSRNVRILENDYENK